MAKKNANQQLNRRLLVFVVLLLIAIGIFTLFPSKSKSPIQHTQQLAVTYSGTFPCADCSGLVTTLTLIKPSPRAMQGPYVLHELYEGKSTSPFVTKGTWSITNGLPDDKDAKLLTLTNNDGVSYYRMNGTSQVQMLDQQKQTIDSPFNTTLREIKDSSPTTEKQSSSTLVNPASMNCAQQGGTLSIKKRGDGGEYGLCTFEDNQACEEWALYRNECPVGGVKTTGFDTIEQQYCAWSGGQTLASPDASCTLPSGSVCKNTALYNGTCETINI